MEFFFTLVLRELHLPRSCLTIPSAQDETPHCVVLCVETLDRARFIQKGHNLGLSFELEASPETALLSKFTANVQPGLPQGLSCNAASMDFSRSSFQNLCHNCICKEVVFGINSWLADGFTQWSLYQAPSIYRQSRSTQYLAQGSEIY